MDVVDPGGGLNTWLAFRPPAPYCHPGWASLAGPLCLEPRWPDSPFSWIFGCAGSATQLHFSFVQYKHLCLYMPECILYLCSHFEVALTQAFFKRIAVTFSTHASFVVIEAQANSVYDRIPSGMSAESMVRVPKYYFHSRIFQQGKDPMVEPLCGAVIVLA